MGSSYGYNRNEDIADYRSARELILMLVDIVSRGGNLCLDIGPRADGKIPVIMQERLREIGGWLKRNGEAIYGTRMWRTPCQWSEGLKPEAKRGEFMSGYDILKETLQPEAGRAVKEVFFTYRNSDLYAITPRWPGKRLVIKNVRADRKSRVTWLATGQGLEWKNRKEDLIISLPEFNPEALSPELLCAYAFRISGLKKDLPLAGQGKPD